MVSEKNRALETTPLLTPKPLCLCFHKLGVRVRPPPTFTTAPNRLSPHSPAAFTWLPCSSGQPESQPSPEYREWEDPTCFAVGKEPAHAHFFGCESREVALGPGRKGSTRCQSLNGAWRFRCAPTVREGLVAEHNLFYFTYALRKLLGIGTMQVE